MTIKTGHNNFNENNEEQIDNNYQAVVGIEEAVKTYKQQVRNLEKFRTMFFEVQEQFELLEKQQNQISKPENKTTPANSNTPNTLETVRSNSQENIKQVRALEDTLRKLETSDSELRSVIDNQLSELQKIGRALEESQSCSEMLEQEISRLIEENETLRDNTTTSSKPQENITFDDLPPMERDSFDDSEQFFDDANTSIENADDSENSPVNPPTGNIKSLEKELKDATDMAFSAMRSNADMGAVIHFLMESFSKENIQSLIGLFYQSISSYNISCHVTITHLGKLDHFGPEGKVNSAEIKLLTTNLKKGSTIDLDSHLIFNYEHTHIIAKDFSRDDILGFNNLRDNFQVLIRGIDTNVERIDAENTAHKERSNLEKLIKTTHKALEKIERRQNKDCVKIQNMITDTVMNFRAAVNKTSISSDQKNILMKNLVENTSKLEKLVKSESYIDVNFMQIINSLSDSLSDSLNKQSH